MKDDKQKARDELKKRDDTRKGVKPDSPEEKDEDTKRREKAMSEDWLGIGFGVKRGG